MAASQDGLVTLRMVVCGGDLTYLSLVGWLAGHAGHTLIRESVFETRDALFAGCWTVVWSAEPMVLLRLAVVVGVRAGCWKERIKSSSGKRPIMMRRAEGTGYEL